MSNHSRLNMTNPFADKGPQMVPGNTVDMEGEHKKSMQRKRIINATLKGLGLLLGMSAAGSVGYAAGAKSHELEAMIAEAIMIDEATEATGTEENVGMQQEPEAIRNFNQCLHLHEGEYNEAFNDCLAREGVFKVITPAAPATEQVPTSGTIQPGTMTFDMKN